MPKPSRISASPAANYMSQEALALGRMSTPASTCRKPYSARSDAQGQSPRLAPWSGTGDGFAPSDAPVARATQIYHCPEKEEQRDSCPFLQNDWFPSAIQTSARVVIFLGQVETSTPPQHSKQHLLEPCLLLQSASVPLPKPRLVSSTSHT